MTFSSLIFIYGFLPLSLGIYYITPKKHRNKSLFVISTLFLALCGLEILAVTAIFVLLNYLSGLAVGAFSKYRPISALFLTLGTAADIAVLLLFRTELFSLIRPFSVAVPLGLCFLTVTAIGYLADVFRKRIKAEKNFFRFMLYMTYFPKLPMGPVIGCGAFSGKLEKRRDGFSSIGEGAELFVCGLAKKVILADNLQRLHEAVITMKVGEISAVSAWLGVISYMLGIYFLLSGLSDMGAGLSLCFGIRLPSSFKYPLFSRGVTDFGKKWHMPVVRTVRRNIEAPVISRSGGNLMKYIMAASVWVIMGLWYEISPNKLVWGLIIGISIALEMRFADYKSMRSTSVVYTLMLLTLSWIFFFGDTLSYSFRYFLALIGGNNNIADSVSLYLLKSYGLLIAVGALAASGIFRKYLYGSKLKPVRKIVRFMQPVFTMLILAVCTALISYSGVCEHTLISL